MTHPTWIFFSLLMCCACGSDDADSEPEVKTITTEVAGDFNTYFTRYGNGWTGGDVGYSVPLPDGRIVWFFGDSFLGTVNPDRTRAPQGFINNSFMVQQGNNFTTLSGAGPSAFLKPDNPDYKYWPQHGFVRNDKLYVLLYTWKANSSGGSFGFDFVRADLAIFSLPDLSLETIKTVGDNSVIWGAAVMTDGNYIYIYGSKDMPTLNQVNLARVAIDNPEGPWEYYSSFGWVQDNSANKNLLEGNSNQFSVLKHGDAYYLFTQEDASLSNKIYRYKAPAPEGPFTDKKLVFETPNYGPDTWTYNAKAHPEFMGEDNALLISYDVNCFDFNKLFANADLYRPYFIRVKNWE